MGLIGGIVHTLRAWRSRGDPGPAFDLRPADGVVEVVPLPGVRSEPNPRDPRFGRFLELDSEDGSKPASRRRGVPPLLGRVAIASLFLGRDGKSWSDPEIARTLDAVIRAARWVEHEAIRHHAAVNLDLAGVYFVADDPVSEAEVELAILPEGDRDGLFEADAEVKLVASASRGAGRSGSATWPNWPIAWAGGSGPTRRSG